MRLPARRSLRGWILGLVLLTTGLSLLIASLAMVGQDLERYRRNASLDLSTQADIVALSSASAPVFDDRVVAERNLQALRVRPDVLSAPLNRADGLSKEAPPTLFEMSATGGQISVAYSGTEAWELAAKWHPEVLILDIGMPGLNGYELARRVRRHSWGSQALLIASSGWGQREDKERALEAGFDRHLTKPVNPDELLRLLDEFALQKKGQRVPEAAAQSA